MKHVCAKGLSLAAVFVALGVAAASASAAGPEFQVENKKTKTFEPLKKKVAFTQSGTGTTLRSGSEVELVCASSSGKGKLTGPKTLTVKMTYAGCETADGTSCQAGKKLPGKSKPGQITIQGRLVDALKGSVLAPAIELGPASGTSILEYTCGSKQVVVSGHVLGAIGPLEEPTRGLTETFAEGAEPEPGCGTQEIQLVEGIGPCRHLELETGSADKKPATTTGTTNKELKGTVSLLK
jgi:hypothetical protein